MHVGVKIALGVGIVGAAALALSACSTEKDADTFGLDKFKDFDRSPQDNKWTQNEVVRTTARNHTQEVNTYRVGDYIFGTRQIMKTTTTSSMQRIFDAAKGNDAVLSLQELRDFTLKNFDADKNGTLNRDERKKFGTQFDATSRSQTALVGSEGFSRYSPRNDYPDPGYPGGGSGGGTSPGDDYGGGYNPPSNGGGSTSPGDDGGGYTPPSNGGGSTSPGDGGGYTPPPSNGGGSTPPSTGSGNSSDNGNPSEDDF
jgi:hypothetical protein